MELLYTVAEVAKIFKVNPNKIYELIRAGKLKGLKLGNMKVPRYEVIRFLKDNLDQDLSDPMNVRPIEL